MAEPKDIRMLPFGKRNNYPHMKPYDVAIWERFMLAFPDVYDHCIYDCPVGAGSQFDPTVNDENGADLYDLYRRKIDVVGFKDNQIDIIEVKPQAGTSALGQVVGYRELYIRDEKPAVFPKAVIVTDRLLPDMDMLAARLGVQIVVV
jgi:hypothetical protein